MIGRRPLLRVPVLLSPLDAAVTRRRGRHQVPGNGPDVGRLQLRFLLFTHILGATASCFCWFCFRGLTSVPLSAPVVDAVCVCVCVFVRLHVNVCSALPACSGSAQPTTHPAEEWISSVHASDSARCPFQIEFITSSKAATHKDGFVPRHRWLEASP